MDIQETMLACQVTEFNKPLTLHRIPTPKPGAKELLIRIVCAGLCHSDHMLMNGTYPFPLPLTVSHEGAGTVAAWGSEVTGWEVGERVLCPIASGHCGKCRHCKGEEAYQRYCFKAKQRGVQLAGAFAEYMLVDAEETLRLPAAIPFDMAPPLACAGRTIHTAISLPSLAPGSTLCILGSGGGLGHIGIQFAKSLGLRVIGIDARDAALTLSTEMGADLVLDARKGDAFVIESVRTFTGASADEEGGADAAINVAEAPTAPGLAAAVTRRQGTVVQVAAPVEGIGFPFHELLIRDVRVRGSFLGGKRSAERMLEMVVERGVVVKREVVSGLEGVNGLVERAERGDVGKGVVRLREE